ITEEEEEEEEGIRIQLCGPARVGEMAGDPSMEILQESGWEELRKEARKIEGDLDVKLSSYGKLGASTSRSWKSMEMEIESLLEKLLDVNDSMSRCAASAAPTTSVTQKLARHRDILHEFTQVLVEGVVFRFAGFDMRWRSHLTYDTTTMTITTLLMKGVDEGLGYVTQPENGISAKLLECGAVLCYGTAEINVCPTMWVGEYRSFKELGLSGSRAVPDALNITLEQSLWSFRMFGCARTMHTGFSESLMEFRRIKGNINSMREHAELLTSVRDDISEYKASGSMSPRIQLLRERAAIHGNVAHMDEVIIQAQTTRAALGSQRAMFGDVQGKVKQLSDKFPIVRGLIGSIRRKRSRDTLILSAVIAACTLFLIIYWLSK
ncbi:hypothetical protein RJ640_006773, partial [Escallonia rubra]